MERPRTGARRGTEVNVEDFESSHSSLRPSMAAPRRRARLGEGAKESGGASELSRGFTTETDEREKEELNHLLEESYPLPGEAEEAKPVSPSLSPVSPLLDGNLLQLEFERRTPGGGCGGISPPTSPTRRRLGGLVHGESSKDGVRSESSFALPEPSEQLPSPRASQQGEGLQLSPRSRTRSPAKVPLLNRPPPTAAAGGSGGGGNKRTSLVAAILTNNSPRDRPPARDKAAEGGDTLPPSPPQNGLAVEGPTASDTSRESTNATETNGSTQKLLSGPAAKYSVDGSSAQNLSTAQAYSTLSGSGNVGGMNDALGESNEQGEGAAGGEKKGFKAMKNNAPPLVSVDLCGRSVETDGSSSASSSPVTKKSSSTLPDDEKRKGSTAKKDNKSARSSKTDARKPSKAAKKPAPKRQHALLKADETLDLLNTALQSKPFQPDHLGRWYWDLVVMFSMCYYWLFLPTSVAMPRETLWLGYWGCMGAEIFIWVVWVADIAVQCNTATVEEDSTKVVEDRKEIFQAYKAAHLWRDVAAAVPIDLIILLAAGTDWLSGWPVWAGSLIRTLCKLERKKLFFRVITPVRISARAVKFLYQRLPTIILVRDVVLILNWMVVLWIVVNQDGVQSYRARAHSYHDAMYWVLQTITTVGYGDVAADNTQKQLFASLMVILGGMSEGIIISIVERRSTKGDVEGRKLETMKETAMVLKYVDMPTELTNEVLAFQYHRLTSEDLDESGWRFLTTLPAVMQKRIGLFVRVKFINQVQMFKDLPVECLVDLANSLQREIIEPEKTIIKAGDDGREMYFLCHGVVQVLSPQGDPWASMKPGAAFGEIALLTDAKRMATIQSLTYCELFRLDKIDFGKLIRKYQALRESVADELKKRNITTPENGTVFTLEASSPYDSIGLSFAEGPNGLWIDGVDPDSSAGRAGIFEGMQLIDVEGCLVSVMDDLYDIDIEYLFEWRGYLCLRLKETTPDEQKENEEAAVFTPPRSPVNACGATGKTPPIPFIPMFNSAAAANAFAGSTASVSTRSTSRSVLSGASYRSPRNGGSQSPRSHSFLERGADLLDAANLELPGHSEPRKLSAAIPVRSASIRSVHSVSASPAPQSPRGSHRGSGSLPSSPKSLRSLASSRGSNCDPASPSAETLRADAGELRSPKRKSFGVALSKIAVPGDGAAVDGASPGPMPMPAIGIEIDPANSPKPRPKRIPALDETQAGGGGAGKYLMIGAAGPLRCTPKTPMSLDELIEEAEIDAPDPMLLSPAAGAMQQHPPQRPPQQAHDFDDSGSSVTKTPPAATSPLSPSDLLVPVPEIGVLAPALPERPTSPPIEINMALPEMRGDGSPQTPPQTLARTRSRGGSPSAAASGEQMDTWQGSPPGSPSQGGPHMLRGVTRGAMCLRRSGSFMVHDRDGSPGDGPLGGSPAVRRSRSFMVNGGSPGLPAMARKGSFMADGHSPGMVRKGSFMAGADGSPGQSPLKRQGSYLAQGQGGRGAGRLVKRGSFMSPTSDAISPTSPGLRSPGEGALRRQGSYMNMNQAPAGPGLTRQMSAMGRGMSARSGGMSPQDGGLLRGGRGAGSPAPESDTSPAGLTGWKRQRQITNQLSAINAMGGESPSRQATPNAQPGTLCPNGGGMDGWRKNGFGPQRVASAGSDMSMKSAAIESPKAKGRSVYARSQLMRARQLSNMSNMSMSGMGVAREEKLTREEERQLQELASRVTRIETRVDSYQHTLAHVEVMTSALENTLKIVAEKKRLGRLAGSPPSPLGLTAAGVVRTESLAEVPVDPPNLLPLEPDQPEPQPSTATVPLLPLPKEG